MRGLKAAVIIMGVLIVAGVAVLVVLLAQRVVGAAPSANAMLDEPPGTHIVNASTSGDRILLQLQGGGPDRVVVLDLRSGHVLGRAALTR